MGRESAVTNIRSCCLSRPQRQSAVPAFGFGKKLANLTHLNVSYSGLLVGQVPISISRLTKLISLDLSSYSYGPYALKLEKPDLGTIIRDLSNLKELNLDGVNISSSGTEWCQAISDSVPGLQLLSLQESSLSGPIDSSLSKLQNLSILRLDFNNLSSHVPDFFANFSSLTVLSLSGCGLKGIDLSISHRIVGSSLLFPSLDTLKLQSCNLMAIPSFLKHKKNMGLLDLSNNRINGVIPKWIWGIGRSMNLSYNLFNDIERPLPDPLTMMSINSLDLHSNMLQGQIPLLRAQFLDYSNNYFTGSIPINISAYLLGTSAFSLANNNLTGEIPASICDTYLQILDLSKNNLSGSIQGCLLESLSNLQALNLRENQFQGILPQNINSSCSLVTIDFYGNKFEGEIPKSLSKCEKLEFLDLGSNKLAGSFPYWLGNLPSLKVLVLSENGFYGRFECPPGVYVGNHTFEMLQILDISSNNFTGSLPSDCFTRMKAMMIRPEGTETIGFSHFGLVQWGDPYYHNAPPSAYFEDVVTVTAKGSKRELVKIPTTTAYIDVSNNRFEGVLPEFLKI
ncbi:receptor-like protein 33 [Dioscorea cayenensis subsp. rotundata]|uniref:Receptor-like protein 33 n=1 Tax=Dioscorea cayennensis subsp. rotundata TaxID=55577 RepID=A0AB40ATA3_DIOCR|nr:receptor-like protein 33 [Dioscorea cayenensis subsp. rotundata]